jgi:hypothetical protein
MISSRKASTITIRKMIPTKALTCLLLISSFGQVETASALRMDACNFMQGLGRCFTHCRGRRGPGAFDLQRREDSEDDDDGDDDNGEELRGARDDLQRLEDLQDGLEDLDRRQNAVAYRRHPVGGDDDHEVDGDEADPALIEPVGQSLQS